MIQNYVQSNYIFEKQHQYVQGNAGQSATKYEQSLDLNIGIIKFF